METYVITSKPEEDRRSGPAPNKALLGLLIFIGTEVMFFGGLISAFLILRAGAATWPPIDQPRLPVAVTGLNTLFLIFSGYAMRLALKAFRKGNLSGSVKLLLITAVLGAIFLIIQGTEWVLLLSYGLTFTSSVYGGTFYTLIGCHGLHVLAAMIALLFVLKKTVAKTYSLSNSTGLELCSTYWYFVVGIWPILYVLMYLN